MIQLTWDGCVQPDALNDDEAKAPHALADAAKKFDWAATISMVKAGIELSNATRPGGSSLFAPLHQAAYGGAPEKVVEALLDMEAWRTLQNARGERPVDVAARQGYSHLTQILTPKLALHVPNGILLKIQSHFHDVILGRAKREIDKHRLRLPELEPLLEIEVERPPLEGDGTRMWFPVPGMYGGFAYKFESDGVNAKLVAESWCITLGCAMP
jgi:hypothetical protein